MYEQWSLSMFNTLFTSLVVIALGIFEQDLRASTLIAVPELYTKGQRSEGFNLKVYFGWMALGLAEAAIIFFTMVGFWGGAQTHSRTGVFPMGDMTFTACVILIAVKCQFIEQRFKSIAAVIAFVASVGGWFLWNIILSGVYGKNNVYDVKGGFLHRFGRSGLWWTVLILSVASCIMLEIGVRAFKAAFFPTDVEIFQSLEQDLDVRKRFEEASAPWMQAGWNHGTKRSSLEIRFEEAAQAKREHEVQELLNRPRVLEDGHGKGPTTTRLERIETEERPVFVSDAAGRRSTDIQEMLSQRYGDVRRGSLSQP